MRVGYQGAVAVSDHTLRISSHGAAPAEVPYSVFGNLSFSAAYIEQGGVVRAPLGKIVLGDDLQTTSHEVRLLSGSTTSVSGAGLVMPYGGTTDGIDYLYNGKSVVLNGITGDKNGVAIGGQYIEVQNGALIDLSGGGDLRGAGFISGRGGSTDARFNPLVRNATDGTFSLPGLASNPVYAIVPGKQSRYAPILAEAGAVDPRIGQQVTIGAGVPGWRRGLTRCCHPPLPCCRAHSGSRSTVRRRRLRRRQRCNCATVRGPAAGRCRLPTPDCATVWPVR